MDKKRRSRLSGLAKTFLAVLIVLAAAEAASRRLFPKDALVYRDSENPRLGFELLPGARGMKNGVPVSINEDGMRDASLFSPKPAEERRVVVVGGQETFGVGVDEDRIFARLAGEGLDVPGRVHTLNLSMYSYNLAQKVELACERLPRLKPEVVVLQASDEDSGGLPPPAVNAPRLKNWVRAHSALVRRAAEGRYLQTTHGSATPVEKGVADPEAKPPAAQEQLRRFWSCVKAAGATGAVMMISSPSGDGTPSATARGLKASARELGLPYTDAGAAIRRLPDGERTLGVGPFLSPAAHRAAAEELKRLLKPLLRRKKPISTRPST